LRQLKVKVEVRLKSGVLDPQGKAVLGALHNLGYEEVEDTRVGKLIELRVRDENPQRVRERVEEMCKKLLSNPVIEDYLIEIET